MAPTLNETEDGDIVIVDRRLRARKNIKKYNYVILPSPFVNDLCVSVEKMWWSFVNQTRLTSSYAKELSSLKEIDWQAINIKPHPYQLTDCQW